MGGVADRDLSAICQPDSFGQHLALRQRARLVGADVGHAAHRLQRSQFADNHVALGHGFGAQCRGDGQHGDERLGNYSYCDTDTVDEDLIVDVETADREDDDGKRDGEGEQQQGELAQRHLEGGAVEPEEHADLFLGQVDHFRDALFPFGALLGLSQQAGNLADLCGHADSSDDTSGSAACYCACRVDHVDTVPERHVLVGKDPVSMLADGQGLAGQEGLIGGEIDAVT